MKETSTMWPTEATPHGTGFTACSQGAGVPNGREKKYFNSAPSGHLKWWSGH